jgi:O-acetyl-ADP-ribose deacetylase (regulator of RNase III)
VGGFPLADCAEIMVAVASEYEPVTLERVVFAVYGDEAADAFNAALSA